ncbi:MAG: hypothetical protein ACOX69_09595 [Coriobacteriales bacterium]
MTLPKAAREDGQVNALLDSYRKQQLVCAAVLTLIALFGALAGTARAWAGPLMIAWSIWLLAAIVVPEVIFALTNRKLMALKHQRGWHGAGTDASKGKRVTVADIKNAAQTYPKTSGIWFLLAVVASFVPAFLDAKNVGIYLLFSGFALMMWAIFAWCYRDRSEMVDDNEALTQTLTRIRRRAWSRVSLFTAAITALWSWVQFLFQGSPLLYFVGFMVPSLALCVVAVATEMRLRGLQERLTQSSGEGFYVDEDDRWIFGIFYYNPDDSKLVVNDRVGMNSSFNLARPAGKVIAVLIALLLLSIPVMGVFMADEFGSPVQLELSDQSVHAHHSLTTYDIDIADVASVELIDELPQMTRTFGGAAETFLEGDFTSEKYGSLKVCLNPEVGPWLLVRTTDGTTYLLGADDASQTQAVAEYLA